MSFIRLTKKCVVHTDHVNSICQKPIEAGQSKECVIVITNNSIHKVYEPFEDVLYAIKNKEDMIDKESN